MNYDPHEPGQRRAPFAKNAADEDFLGVLNAVLCHAALPSAQVTRQVDHLPLMYIVGVPRSGTTLLSQLVSRYLPVGYINNLMARFWLRPSVGIRLSQAILGPHAREHISFVSTHGTTAGICEPHEFGYFWRYWLKMDEAPTHHLSAQALHTIDREGLRRALQQEILASFNSPVVFKNVICGFHAAFLTALHPASLFIYITRDPLATAASILAVRRERFGSYHVWWSLKPSTYPFDVAPGDVGHEVAMQVVTCQREIEQALQQPEVHSVRLTYEALCARPLDSLERLCQKLAELGYRMAPLGTTMPSLTPAPVAPLPLALLTRLKECLARLC